MYILQTNHTFQKNKIFDQKEWKKYNSRGVLRTYSPLSVPVLNAWTIYYIGPFSNITSTKIFIATNRCNYITEEIEPDEALLKERDKTKNWLNSKIDDYPEYFL